MNSRERVRETLNHREPDRVPVDCGATSVTGIQAVALNKLRNALGLEDQKVKVHFPMMLLGKVEEDVKQALSIDIAGVFHPRTSLGYKNKNWKPWTLPNGTEVLIGEGFEVTHGNNGEVYAYPAGEKSSNPSAKLPSNGHYFDNIARQEPLSEKELNPREDFGDMYSTFTQEECLWFEEKSTSLFKGTDRALFGNFWESGIGDIFLIPGPMLTNPKGIRDEETWIKAHITNPDYIKEIFDMQTEIALKNLELYHQAVKERIEAIGVSATDFGTQDSLLYSPDIYRELYKPYHKKVNKWIHNNTTWKTFFHTDGNIVELLDDFVEIGVDIINPVQFTANGMDLRYLKNEYGEDFVFWGGGVDTQSTLPFGSPKEVMEETRENVKILSEGGGYICSSVHNIQGPTPIENIIAFFDSIIES